MSKLKRIFLYTATGAFGILIILILRPVPQPTPENTSCCKGLVEKVFESGTRDITIKLRGDKKTYYINRGLERGLNLDTLQKLLNRTVEIRYIRHWTPLDYDQSGRPVAQLTHEDLVLFSSMPSISAN